MCPPTRTAGVQRAAYIHSKMASVHKYTRVKRDYLNRLMM